MQVRNHVRVRGLLLDRSERQPTRPYDWGLRRFALCWWQMQSCLPACLALLLIIIIIIVVVLVTCDIASICRRLFLLSNASDCDQRARTQRFVLLFLFGYHFYALLSILDCPPLTPFHPSIRPSWLPSPSCVPASPQW